MSEPNETPATLADAHANLVVAWLLGSGKDLEGRRLRSEFARGIEANASQLRIALGVGYDSARSILAGRALHEHEARALVRLWRDRRKREAELCEALEAAAGANVADGVAAIPETAAAVS